MRQIGERLCLSKSTIETYKRRIFEKLNFNSMADLIAYAIKFKLYREPASHEMNDSKINLRTIDIESLLDYIGIANFDARNLLEVFTYDETKR
jgi:hypothetical protein